MRNLFLFLVFITASMFSLEKRPFFKEMSTSVIIPCYYKHACYLPQILKKYAEGTVMPDEIVISLSEANKVSKEIFDKINSNWPFAVVLLKADCPVSEGGNRNKAASIAEGDIIICNDADDFPHPQRIEIIKYFFENYKIDHFMHTWLEENSPIEFYTNFENFKKIELNVYQTSSLGSGHFHNGAPVITKEVFQRIKWNEGFRIGIDVLFNREVYQKFPYKIVIEAPIYIYRHKLSSYKMPDTLPQNRNE